MSVGVSQLQLPTYPLSDHEPNAAANDANGDMSELDAGELSDALSLPSSCAQSQMSSLHAGVDGVLGHGESSQDRLEMSVASAKPLLPASIGGPAESAGSSRGAFQGSTSDLGSSYDIVSAAAASYPARPGDDMARPAVLTVAPKEAAEAGLEKMASGASLDHCVRPTTPNHASSTHSDHYHQWIASRTPPNLPNLRTQALELSDLAKSGSIPLPQSQSASLGPDTADGVAKASVTQSAVVNRYLRYKTYMSDVRSSSPGSRSSRLRQDHLPSAAIEDLHRSAVTVHSGDASINLPCSSAGHAPSYQQAHDKHRRHDEQSDASDDSLASEARHTGIRDRLAGLCESVDEHYSRSVTVRPDDPPASRVQASLPAVEANSLLVKSSSIRNRGYDGADELASGESSSDSAWETERTASGKIAASIMRKRRLREHRRFGVNQRSMPRHSRFYGIIRYVLSALWHIALGGQSPSCFSDWLRVFVSLSGCIFFSISLATFMPPDLVTPPSITSFWFSMSTLDIVPGSSPVYAAESPSKARMSELPGPHRTTSVCVEEDPQESMLAATVQPSAPSVPEIPSPPHRKDPFIQGDNLSRANGLVGLQDAFPTISIHLYLHEVLLLFLSVSSLIYIVNYGLPLVHRVRRGTYNLCRLGLGSKSEVLDTSSSRIALGPNASEAVRARLRQAKRIKEAASPAPGTPNDEQAATLPSGGCAISATEGTELKAQQDHANGVPADDTSASWASIATVKPEDPASYGPAASQAPRRKTSRSVKKEQDSSGEGTLRPKAAINIAANECATSAPSTPRVSRSKVASPPPSDRMTRSHTRAQRLRDSVEPEGEVIPASPLSGAEQKGAEAKAKRGAKAKGDPKTSHAEPTRNKPKRSSRLKAQEACLGDSMSTDSPLQPEVPSSATRPTTFSIFYIHGSANVGKAAFLQRAKRNSYFDPENPKYPGPESILAFKTLQGCEQLQFMKGKTAAVLVFAYGRILADPQGQEAREWMSHSGRFVMPDQQGNNSDTRGPDIHACLYAYNHDASRQAAINKATQLRLHDPAAQIILVMTKADLASSSEDIYRLQRVTQKVTQAACRNVGINSPCIEFWTTSARLSQGIDDGLRDAARHLRFILKESLGDVSLPMEVD